MVWEIEFTEEFEAWWDSLSIDQQEAVTDRVVLLGQRGPDLGRPVVERIHRSRHHNMKELRASKGGVGAAELRARQCGGCRLTLDNAELQSIAATADDVVVPIGVVMGPLSATFVRRHDSSTFSGKGVPAVFMMSTPASTCSQFNATPVAASTFLTVSQISGPVPSPGISVTLYATVGSSDNR